MSKRNFVTAIEVLGEEIARMRKELRVHKSEEERLSRKCDENLKTISQMVSELAKVREERAELVQRVAEKGNRIAQLKTELNTTKEWWEHRCDMLEDSLADAKDEAHSWQSESDANYEESRALSEYAEYLEIRVAAFHSLSADDSVFCADDMREVFNVSEIMKNHQLDREKEEENES